MGIIFLLRGRKMHFFKRRHMAIDGLNKAIYNHAKKNPERKLYNVNNLFKLMLLLSTLVPKLAYSACVIGIPPSTPNSQLQDNGKGTITDTETGLMWKQCSEGQADDSNCSGEAARYTWGQALQHAETVNINQWGGYSDWRLPNIKELRSLVEESCYGPAINSIRFPNTSGVNYWSSSIDVTYGQMSAWAVSFYDSNIKLTQRDNDFNSALRLVRNSP